MKPALFSLVLVGLVVGCAGSSNQVRPKGTQDALAQRGPAKSSDPNEIVCVMERSVGSNIPERVCRDRASMEDERDATQMMIETMNNKNGLRY